MAMMLERALRLIQDMAATGAHLRYFFPLLERLLPYYLGMALPAAFMIALILLVTRLAETLELEAMLASRVSLARIAAPLVGFGIAVGAAALLANGWLEPAGRFGYRALRAEARHAARLESLQPGAFYRPAQGLVLTFERRGAAPGRVEGIFVAERLGRGRERLLTARAGTLGRSADGRLQLLLEDGLSFEDADPQAKMGAYALAFRRYAMREPLLLGPAERTRGADQKELTLPELVREIGSGRRGMPRAALEAELYSRLARSLTLPLLPLLAIPLAFAAKKRRAGLGIALGGGVLMAFHHGINLVKDVAVDGGVPPAPAFGLLTVSFVGFVLWLFAASRHLPSHGPLTALLARTGSLGREARRPRLLPLPGRTIGRYVASGFAVWTVAAGVTAILLLQMVDMFERGDDFVERGFGLREVGRYALLRLPLLAQQTLAIAALVGALLALLRLTRFSEMVAIRGAGISLPRLFVMLLPIAGLLSLASLALAEQVTPRAGAELASWWRATGRPADDPERWFRLGGEIVRLDSVRANGAEIRGLAIYRLEDGILAERITAGAAHRARGGWELRRAIAVRPAPEGIFRRLDARRLWPTMLAGGDVRALGAPAPQLSSADARRALAGTAPVAEGPPRFETRLQRLAAEPLAPVVMLLLALPLALASSRTGPPLPLLLYPIVAGIAFLVSDGVLTVAAQTGMVAPWIGAWAAPLGFGLLAVTVLVYADG
jgi:lipopolysaccharide export system permease protein